MNTYITITLFDTAVDEVEYLLNEYADKGYKFVAMLPGAPNRTLEYANGFIIMELPENFRPYPIDRPRTQTKE